MPAFVKSHKIKVVENLKLKFYTLATLQRIKKIKETILYIQILKTALIYVVTAVIQK